MTTLEHLKAACIKNNIQFEESPAMFGVMLNRHVWHWFSKDGDKWCVLYGSNLQEGVAGFGDTPHLAILDFNKAMYNN